MGTRALCREQNDAILSVNSCHASFPWFARLTQHPGCELVTLTCLRICMQFFADTSGVLTKELDMVLDAAGPMRKLGNPRCKRFGLYVDKGVIKHVAVSESADDPAGDAPGANANSAVGGMLAAIKAL